MANNDIVDGSQSTTSIAQYQSRRLEIPNALPVRLQVLDLSRNVAIDLKGKRFVVATFDDRRIGRGFVTAVYPQQNGYLTLVRLTVCELRSETPEEALRKHIQVIQTIQQGKLNDFVRSLQ